MNVLNKKTRVLAQILWLDIALVDKHKHFSTTAPQKSKFSAFEDGPTLFNSLRPPLKTRLQVILALIDKSAANCIKLVKSPQEKLPRYNAHNNKQRNV